MMKITYESKHFTMHEYLTAFNVGSLCFCEGLAQFLNKYFKVMLRLSLFQKTSLEVFSRKYRKNIK